MTPPTLAFDLPGGWTSPHLYIRLLTIVDGGEWEPLRSGFTRRGTKEKAQLAMGPPSPELAAAFALGVDPFAPSIDEDLLDEIEGHQAVVSVLSHGTAGAVEKRALTVVRATNAALNGGAMAVRCRTSGLARSAAGFQQVAAEIEAAAEAGRPALMEALLAAYVLPSPRWTIGMHALGLPDVVLAESGDPDTDLARVRAAAVALARGEGDASTRPDDRGLAAPLSNPYGLVSPAS